jgi:RNA polymerase primary sigma factor
MEETLKPAALERFRGDHRSLQEIRQAPERAHGRDERRPRILQGRREEVSGLSRAAHGRGRERPVHGAKIEYLVDQLYSYSRRLNALGGQMLRLAERHKVPRRAFLDAYMGHELDEGWAERVCGTDRKWNAFCTTEARRSSASAARSARSRRPPA